MQKTRKRMIILGLILVSLVAAITVLSVLERRLVEEDERRAVLDVPEGWQIILKGENFMSMAEQGDILWGGSRNGVFKIDRLTGELIKKMEFCREVIYVTSVLVDHEGKLWVTHQEGVATWDGKDYNYYSEEDVLPDNRANYVTLDSQNNIWVGTWGGASVYDGNSWRTITEDDGLSDNMVNIIFEDSLGSMWFGSYIIRNNAISILNDGKWQYFTMENGLPNNNVTSFLELKEGSMLVGTGFYNRGGAAIFDYKKGEWTIEKTLDENDGLAGEKVRSLFKDSLGNLWFGSEFDGIAIKDPEGNFTVLTEEEGLSHNEVLSILQDVDGTLWLGTLDGITRLNLDAVRRCSGVDTST